MAIKINGTDIINDDRALLNYGLVKTNLGNISGPVTLSLSSGNYFTATLTSSTTFTFSTELGTSVANGFILKLTNGGNYAIVWPNNIFWADGLLPILTSNGTDILIFMTDDSGITWNGSVSMQDLT